MDDLTYLSKMMNLVDKAMQKPTIIGDLKLRQAQKLVENAIHDECVELLKEFQWIIRQEALWVYDMPYSQLPQMSQRAIRVGARELIENKIFDLTEPKC